MEAILRWTGGPGRAKEWLLLPAPALAGGLTTEGHLLSLPSASWGTDSIWVKMFIILITLSFSTVLNKTISRKVTS